MTTKPTARIYRGTPRNLAFLAGVLREGGIVAVPTETVYGLAGNALAVGACRKIFRAKGRPKQDPLIVHIHSLEQLSLVAETNPAALKLARRFWPGPLTLVLPRRKIVPALVSAGLPSVAVRMPRHPLFRQLLKLAGTPLAAPSANPFGYISPTCAEHVRAGLGGKIAHILDGGPASIGVESTIIDLRDPAEPRLLRPGAVTRAQLTRALGCAVLDAQPVKENRAQLAPGRLTRHYSPRTPAVLHDRFERSEVQRSSPNEAWIFASRPRQLTGRNIFWLQDNGSLPSAARQLFATLRRADRGGFSRIHVERVRGAGGLADAINDRLARAASRG